MSDWKEKLKAAKARIDSKPSEAPLPPIVPGDMSKPQNELEQHVELLREIDNNAKAQEEIRSEIIPDIVKETERVLNAEALMTEVQLEKSMDRERFKRIFAATIEQYWGHSIEAINQAIMDRHLVLFDDRTGIQGLLALRAEVLKEMKHEERAKHLKEDFLFKPNAKPERVKSPKSSKPKEPKQDPIEQMRTTLILKYMAGGMSEKEAKAKAHDKLKAFEGL